MAKLKYADCIITEKFTPPDMDPAMIRKMEKWNHLIRWVDERVVPGAFQMNCCWFIRVPEDQPYTQHSHDVPEIIGLFGSDPDNQEDLGGEVEFWMEDEQYTITKSCMIFVPGSVKHCPLILKRIDRPIFHFTVVTSSLYTQTG